MSFTAGERVDEAVGEGRGTGQCHRLVGLLPVHLAEPTEGPVPGISSKRYEFADGHSDSRGQVLRQIGSFVCQRLVVPGVERSSVQGDAAARGRLLTWQQFQKRRLAGAVVPDQPENMAIHRDVERQRCNNGPLGDVGKTESRSLSVQDLTFLLDLGRDCRNPRYPECDLSDFPARHAQSILLDIANGIRQPGR